MPSEGATHMISKTDLQRLLQRPHEGPILSMFLDMSVTAENKRTHHIFLNQQRAQHAELDSERHAHHREPLGRALARIERWIDDEFDESKKGLALFTELDGDWLEAIQLPVPVRNRLTIADHPAIGPLTEVLGQARRYGIILVDREHLRLLSVYLGQVVAEETVTTDPYPVAHDVKAGGFAAKDFQKFKAEEARQSFREFAGRLEAFHRRTDTHRYLLLGTDGNRSAFLEFMPAPIAERVVHESHAPMDATPAQLLDRLHPFFEEDALRERADVVDRVRDRVRHSHFAIAGLGDTLEQLQEGKVETLIVARDLEEEGVQCTKCNFYLVRRNGGCPYCGGELRAGVDLVESMLRIAAEQDVNIEFADPAPLKEFDGVGALLRF
jgi:peptide subunit release factor 1 (eRF1)